MLAAPGRPPKGRMTEQKITVRAPGEPPVDYVEDAAEYERDNDALDTPVEEAELEAVIASLPQGARDVLTLCGIYGYGHGEAATMLGIAEGTCKAQLHRARALVRARLESGVRT